ncbi:unnamed protein product, partial [Ectocarpus sp. 8 AP-2014]
RFPLLCLKVDVLEDLLASSPALISASITNLMPASVPETSLPKPLPSMPSPSSSFSPAAESKGVESKPSTTIFSSSGAPRLQLLQRLLLLLPLQLEAFSVAAEPPW